MDIQYAVDLRANEKLIKLAGMGMDALKLLAPLAIMGGLAGSVGGGISGMLNQAGERMKNPSANHQIVPPAISSAITTTGNEVRKVAPFLDPFAGVANKLKNLK